MAKDRNKRGTALSVNMPMETAQAIYGLVRDGTYDSAGAVIREALLQFLERDGLAPGSPADTAEA